MNKDSDPRADQPTRDPAEAPSQAGGPRFHRRDLLRMTLAGGAGAGPGGVFSVSAVVAPPGGAGLVLDGFIDVPTMRAATKDMKLSQINEFTTACNFCSCGCGMIA